MHVLDFECNEEAHIFNKICVFNTFLVRKSIKLFQTLNDFPMMVFYLNSISKKLKRN